MAASAPQGQAPHDKARPLAKGSVYPAKDLCSQCGLCDSRWVAYVKDSCAFLNQRFEAMEASAHGRSRDLDNEDELYFGVQQRMLTARLQLPIDGAQWTGIVSRIGVRALETGLVDAVLCVGQPRHGRKAVVRALLHAEHRIDQSGFQGAHADAADDAGPLGALDRLLQPGAEHALADTEVELVLVGLVAGAAVGGRFHRLKALVQKGTGLAHVGHPAAVAEAAVAAEVLGGLGAALGQGPGPLVGGQRDPFGRAGDSGHRRALAG